MNRRIFAAKELLKTAKAILADTDYIYDPDHRKRPEGGGWEKTEKGWTKNKKSEDGEKEPGAELEDVDIYSISPSKLGGLTEHPNSNVRKLIAGYAYTPLEVLDRLADDKDPQVRLTLARNWRTPHGALNRLADDPAVHKALASNPNAPREAMNKIAATTEDEEVRRILADSSNTPPEGLATLAEKTSDAWTQHSIARNPHTPKEVLVNMLKSKDGTTRWNAASNPSLPMKVAEQEFRGQLDRYEKGDSYDGSLLRGLLESDKISDDSMRRLYSAANARNEDENVFDSMYDKIGASPSVPEDVQKDMLENEKGLHGLSKNYALCEDVLDALQDMDDEEIQNNLREVARKEGYDV